MALSFEESKKQAQEQTTLAATPMMMSSSANMSTFATESWNKPSNSYIYTYYNNEYSDDKISTVDEAKNINLSDSQINLTQEKNSQYIPFQIPRFYDGFDLSKTELSIYWVNERGAGSSTIPVDVYYSSDKIRFAWLVDDDVTAIAGNIKFEIQARGTNSKGYNYIWKTKSNNGINVIQALEIKSFIEPDETWQDNFISRLSANADRAEQAEAKAKEYAEQAGQYAADLADGLEEEVKATLQNNYYTKGEVDNAIANVTVDLTGYATEEYVDEQIAGIPAPDLSGYALKEEIPTKVSELENDSGYLTEHQDLSNYVLKSEVPSIAGLATETYVDEAVAAVDVSEQLQDYAKSADVYTKEEVDIAIAGVDVSDQLVDYAKEAEVNSKIDALSSSINTNATNISSLGNTVTELQEEVSSIDKSPRLTYDATYNTEGDYSFVLYEIENEGDSEAEVRSEKAKFVIQGGSGSGSTSSTLKIEYVTTTPLVVTTNDKAIITYNFSGTDSSGDAVLDGTATWKVAGRVVATNTVVSGENSFDVTEYLSIGTQKVQLSITDDAGSLVTKNWTVQKIDVRLESTFNDQLTYPIGTVSFDYTPYGAISKDVHFILDGIEVGTVTTTASGIPMSYAIPEQTHGAHLLEVYITAVVNSNTIESNHIYKDIIWYDSTSTVPVIGCTQQEFTVLQYDSTNITYTVYDPSTETPIVTLAVDGNDVSTLTLDSNTQVWQYKSNNVGEHTLTITCGETVKTLKVTIEELDINLEPVTAGLVFDFNPSGKSNNDADRLWSDGDIAMSVSDNFDWVNGGYQIDENGDQYFCIKAGTSAVINYKLFEDDAKRNGKEFKLVFKTTNVESASAQFLSCMDSSIGIEMNVHEAYVYASAGSLYLPYSEEDIIEFEFNINKDTDAIPMVMGYEDGVATRPMVYSDSYNFTQSNPQYITIGSDDCDVFIYRFKVYNTALTDRGILNNFIADARSAEEMVARYNRNQIYDENGQLTPETLAEKCPQLRIIKIEAPHFTNNKSDKVTGTTIQWIYKGGNPILDNWTAYNCQHSGQGTTSNEYGAAGRNLDLIMNKSGVDGVTPYIVLGNGTETNKVSLTRDSVEVNYFNVKVNIASSENANNALLQRRYNTYNPYVRPVKQNDPKVKDTMEFYNCVVFIKESDPDLTTHREFQDNEWHFYGIGNVGDSKKTDNTRLNDPDDPLECIVEIMDNTFPNSTFPGDEEGLANLELDPFDESMTYGWRYEPKDTQACIDAWKEFYKFVVNSTDEEFKANLGNYFVVDSALYFYLFTTRYTMIDNRAKNTFWHYGKCDDGAYRWDLCFDYDNDQNYVSL